jgi:hypothetical protein
MIGRPTKLSAVAYPISCRRVGSTSDRSTNSAGAYESTADGEPEIGEPDPGHGLRRLVDS